MSVCISRKKFTHKTIEAKKEIEIKRNLINPICQFCYEKPGKYFRNGYWVCEINATKCYGKRKKNSYKLIKRLNNGKSLFCDYGCGEVAKYIMFGSGLVCCSSLAINCKKIRIQQLVTRVEKHGKVEPKEVKKENYCACGCGTKVHKKWATGHHSIGKPSWNAGKKRPNHSKKLLERPHHFRGKKGKKNAPERFGRDVVTIEHIKDNYPIFSVEEDIRYDPNSKEKIIQTHCKNSKCPNSKEKEGWFTPNISQISQRYRALDVTGTGGVFIYCSENCKHECTHYNVNSRTLANQYKKQCKINDPQKFDYTQEEYNIWRQEVLKRADYKCEYCGELATDCHHIKPKKLEPFFSLDPDYGLASCEKCHYKKGHSEECSTGQLANLICN